MLNKRFYSGIKWPFESRTIYFAVVILCMINTSCLTSVKPIYYEDEKRRAFETVDKFHTYLDNAQYDRIYNLFSARRRAEYNRDQFVEGLIKIREDAGRFKKYSVIKEEIEPQAEFRRVHLIITSEYEKKNLGRGIRAVSRWARCNY